MGIRQSNPRDPPCEIQVCSKKFRVDVMFEERFPLPSIQSSPKPVNHLQIRAGKQIKRRDIMNSGSSRSQMPSMAFCEALVGPKATITHVVNLFSFFFFLHRFYNLAASSAECHAILKEKSSVEVQPSQCLRQSKIYRLLRQRVMNWWVHLWGFNEISNCIRNENQQVVDWWVIAVIATSLRVVHLPPLVMFLFLGQEKNLCFV